MRCRCEGPPASAGKFWCPRHGVTKTRHLWLLCLRRDDYYRAWEEGRGPGQVSAAARPAAEGDREAAYRAAIAVQQNAVRREWWEKRLAIHWKGGRHRPWPEILRLLDLCRDRRLFPCGGCAAKLEAFQRDLLEPTRWRAEWGPKAVSSQPSAFSQETRRGPGSSG